MRNRIRTTLNKAQVEHRALGNIVLGNYSFDVQTMFPVEFSNIPDLISSA
jgi:hypothetical protein